MECQLPGDVRLQRFPFLSRTYRRFSSRAMIVSSSSLSSFPFSTLVVNRSKPFLKTSKPSYSSHTNPLGQRRADRPHRIGRRQASKSPSYHIARVSRCPSPTVPRSGPQEFRKDFGIFIDSFDFYCVRFPPRFVLDSSTLHSTGTSTLGSSFPPSRFIAMSLVCARFSLLPVDLVGYLSYRRLPYKNLRVWPRQRPGNCGPISSSFVCFSSDARLRACCAAAIFLIFSCSSHRI